MMQENYSYDQTDAHTPNFTKRGTKKKKEGRINEFEFLLLMEIIALAQKQKDEQEQNQKYCWMAKEELAKIFHRPRSAVYKALGLLKKNHLIRTKGTHIYPNIQMIEDICGNATENEPFIKIDLRYLKLLTIYDTEYDAYNTNDLFIHEKRSKKEGK